VQISSKDSKGLAAAHEEGTPTGSDAVLLSRLWVKVLGRAEADYTPEDHPWV